MDYMTGGKNTLLHAGINAEGWGCCFSLGVRQRWIGGVDNESRTQCGEAPGNGEGG
jgi:hypothetical protein